MKKGFVIFLLAACLLLGGCELIPPRSTLPPQTEAPAPAATEPATEPPTEAPTQPSYTNPLTGLTTRGPQQKRIFAVSISNIPDAMPRIGVCMADIYLEMYVNDSIVRGLALYTDPSFVPQIGPVRSTRLMFNDLAMHYDLIVAHAGGSGYVLGDAAQNGVDGFNIDTWDSTDYSFRDKDRVSQGFGWEHVLFARGEGLEPKALADGINVEADPDKDYLLRFLPDGTPAGGEDAAEIDLTLTYHESKKDCRFVYDADRSRYVYWQYGKEMTDGITGEQETYENVIVMFPTDIHIVNSGYQVANFEDGGEGYFASGGKLIPIRWECDGARSPFRFLTADGQQLFLTQGRTFIAITETGSPITWN